MKRNPVGRISASEWQIFSTMRGRGKVARDMTKFLVEELRGIPAGHVVAGQAAYHRWTERVAKAGFARFGALDTEPEVEATFHVERILRLPAYSIDR